MQRPLDPRNFKLNRYERPDQKWVCGRAAEGHPCPLGPDQRGGCRATGQCQPVRRGDRWNCTRTEASGGPCAQGPGPDGACCHPLPPCQPQRSLRRTRGLAVALVVALTIGALFLILGGSWREHWMDPGELAAVHGTSGGRGDAAATCADCHSAPAAQPATALATAHRQRADSQLCLNCHGLGDHPLDPHAVAPRTLAGLTRQAQPPAGAGAAPLALQASRLITGLAPHGADLACATCHREHHGRDASLTHFADAQCQVCHSAQFASFGRGHPEFAAYPYQRRTRLFFDHQSHLEKHFTGEMKDRAPQSCQHCHTTESNGRLMLVRSFQETCAACHAGQIQGEGMTNKGVAFFSVPELDVESLESHGRRIGEWPRADGQLTPFMELLLDGDPGVREALASLRGVQLFDLSKASAEQLAAAEKVAWGVKSLLFDLTTGGHEMLLKRLGMEGPAGRAPLPTALTGHLARAAVMAAQEQWMPHLLTEVPNHRQGLPPPAPEPPAPAPAAAAAPKPATPAVGDDLLDAPVVPAAPAGKKPADDSILDAGDLLAAPDLPKPPAKSPAAADNDLLLDAPAAPAKAPAPASDDLLAAPAETPAPKAAPVAEAKSAEDWMSSGGWYRPKNGFTLFYRPMGHADSFLAGWLTRLANLSPGPSGELARAAFQKLASPEAPGACLKCHTVETKRGVVQVNWHPAQPEPNAHPFTVFNHAAHFSLLGDAGCQTCHQLAPQSAYAKYFAPSDGRMPDNPHRFESNFAPLSKTACAACHQPQIAGDNCLLCHRYHTGTFAPKGPAVTRFPIGLPGAGAAKSE